MRISGSSPAPGRGIALDTSAYSWFRRGEPRVVELLATASRVLVPAVTVGELEAGFATGARRAENQALLQQFLSEAFVSLVAVDQAVAELYGVIFAELKRAGTPIPVNDIWIAACARSRGIPLVTFDRDFLRVESMECLLLEA